MSAAALLQHYCSVLNAPAAQHGHPASCFTAWVCDHRRRAAAEHHAAQLFVTCSCWSAGWQIIVQAPLLLQNKLPMPMEVELYADATCICRWTSCKIKQTACELRACGHLIMALFEPRLLPFAQMHDRADAAVIWHAAGMDARAA